MKDSFVQTMNDMMFDTEHGRFTYTAYPISVTDIDKRIRGYFQLLETFVENSVDEHSFWFNLGQFFKTRKKIVSISTQDNLHRVNEGTLEFIHKMQRRLKQIQMKKSR